MTQVATVYSTLADIRTHTSIIGNEKSNVKKLPASQRNKHVWASIENSAELVIRDVFKLAEYCNQVAKGINIKATKNKLENIAAVDICAKYLLKNKFRLAYAKGTRARVSHCQWCN